MKQYIISTLSKLSFIKSFFEGKAIILMLHRISPYDKNGLAANENMKIDPVYLENFICSAKNKGYHFISLDTLAEMILENNFLSNKNIVITIDDGYKDNYTYGFEIFKKHQIPYCIYLNTSFLQQPNMWWYSLGDFILNQSTYFHPFKKKLINISKATEKNKLFLELRRYILANLTLSNITQIMQNIKVPHNSYKYSELTLSSHEINQMLKSKLFTLGNHTHSHCVLNNLKISELKKDIEECNLIIQKNFGVMPQHFAYPFGGNSENDATCCNIIKSLNFKTAVTTRMGTIYPLHKNFMHVLPRVFFNNQSSIENLVRIRKKKIVTY